MTVAAMKTKEEIFTMLQDVLVEMFEVDPSDVVLQANLYEDLDIDSIDAVDLIVRLKEETGKKLQPEEFKTVRTVDDVVEAVFKLLQ